MGGRHATVRVCGSVSDRRVSFGYSTHKPTPPHTRTPQAYKGRADMVACLLDCGACVNECETRRARTALYLACEFDHADVVRLLLQRGADQVCV